MKTAAKYARSLGKVSGKLTRERDVCRSFSTVEIGWDEPRQAKRVVFTIREAIGMVVTGYERFFGYFIAAR